MRLYKLLKTSLVAIVLFIANPPGDSTRRRLRLQKQRVLKAALSHCVCDSALQTQTSCYWYWRLRSLSYLETSAIEFKLYDNMQHGLSSRSIICFSIIWPNVIKLQPSKGNYAKSTVCRMDIRICVLCPPRVSFLPKH